MYEKVETWFNIVDLEHKILKFWEENDIFNKLLKKNDKGDRWSFIDGPITANNPMGVHHAWGRSLKDAYQRYHAMHGKKQRYQNGFDCQGLWVEVEVEKEFGFKSKKDIEAFGVAKFVQACKERVTKFADRITEQSKRLGYWMKWDNSYFTMSDENNYTIWSFLKKCHERNLIYKGHDVMPWCPRCGTGISQHEMQEGYHEVSHTSVVVKFAIQERKNEYFLVWTTTPWTLTSNVAIAVNPEMDYLKVEQNGEIYYLIKKQAEVILKKDNPWKAIEELKGQKILDLNFTYKGPYDELPAQSSLNYRHTVIPWNEISEEEGSGIVHIAPGCGAEDFILGREFKLNAIAPIDEEGVFIKGFDWLEGKHASTVAPDIVRNLSEKNILYSKEKYKHSYPHCWRCKHELLFRLVDEWYISMDSWREEIKEIVKQITWIPSFGRELELDWLTNMHDWMISKKRYWGLALPIWECKACGNIEVIGSYDELKEKAIEGWDKFDGNSPHKPHIDYIKIKCSKCGKPVSRIPDVGNPWLDAGIVPYSTVHYNSNKEYWEKWVPAHLVLECFPGQFRNWFYSLLAMSTMMENIPPFKTLVGHALVRDANGEEMHKSKGNAIWFDDAVEKMGADLMRWQYFENDITLNLNFSFDRLSQIRGKFFNTLWNSYAFYINYARMSNYSPPDEFQPVSQKTDFDRWILSRLQLTIRECREGMEKFNTRNVVRSIETFVDDLSNWYIRHSRRRFWKTKDDRDTQFAFETLYECLHTLIHLLAPLIPFITDAIYQNMVRKGIQGVPESIHLSDYPTEKEKDIDQELINRMDLIMKITTSALAARQKVKIKIRQPLANIDIALADPEGHNTVKQFEKLIKEDLNIKKITLLKAEVEIPLTIKVKPNLKTIGTEFKSQAQDLFKAINERSEAIIEEIKAGKGKFELSIGGENTVISKDHLLIEEVNPPGKSVMAFPEGWLSVDTEISEELQQEGIMREFLRKAQVLRKDVGLEANDRIHVQYSTEDAVMKTVIEKFSDFISAELLCLKLECRDALAESNKIKVYDYSVAMKVEKA
ncbi:MAG: isoleucine--tRNA ligase [Spirochaetales bacterium]|nr:isoleucine--tRNA ligase [Spirochaetales bacterium]